VCGTDLYGQPLRLLHEISYGVFLILSILVFQLAFRFHNAAWLDKYLRLCANRPRHGTDYGLSNRIHWRVWDSYLREIPGEPHQGLATLVGDLLCRLLEFKTQESYYNKIVARYTQFCTHHSKDLESAFACLSVDDSPSTPPPPPMSHASSPNKGVVTPPPSTELDVILLALRKLREALLASSSVAASPIFSQRVHVFNIRLAILALHPSSYHPSLLHLLFVLHSPQYPLPPTELAEMTTYLILDLACRQGELASAYGLRSTSKLRNNFQSRDVDEVLDAVITRNWVKFWRVQRRVDGYVRALIHWAVDDMRRDTLKALGRAYMSSDLRWVLHSASGGEMSWEELVKKENMGWVKDDDKIIIRKPKAKPSAVETGMKR
jgi:hypothetical protein